MLVGGATSINAASAAMGLVRNLDRMAERQGLAGTAVQYDTFPLGDAIGTQLISGCGYPNITTHAEISGVSAYTPHLAEGIGMAARNEFLCVVSGATDLIEPQTAIMQGIALR